MKAESSESPTESFFLGSPIKISDFVLYAEKKSNTKNGGQLFAVYLNTTFVFELQNDKASFRGMIFFFVIHLSN